MISISMRYNLYNNFFAKDKPLRHYSQHLIVAIISLSFLYKTLNIPVSFENTLLFLFFTYIPDIDGVISIFTTCKNVTTAKEIKGLITKGKLTDAAEVAATHHKKINRLILHNIIFFNIILAGFIISIIQNNTFWKIACGAVLTHFLFDLSDDFYQLKHIKNWLWFIGPSKRY